MRAILMVALLALASVPVNGYAQGGARAGASPAGGTAVVLAPPRRFSALDRAARSLSAQDLGEARVAGEAPLILVGTAALGPASDRQALFVQLQSARECGSGGCGTTVYLWQHGHYVKVLDQSDGPLMVGPGRTKGMLDLRSDHDRFVWDGTVYRDTNPAPQVDLRPRGPRR